MDFIKINSNEEFIKELNFCHHYFSGSIFSDGTSAIKNRIDEIYEIVHYGKKMLYNQEGYSFLRPFEDCFQDAFDFLNTDTGERVKQVFYYFGYKYLVPKEQIGGYNINPPAGADL